MSDVTYTNYVNNKIINYLSNHEKSVIFGQNIVSGSRISGLGVDLEKVTGVVAINTTNSENSLMGLGFGLALSNIPSIFLMKQHDFALLALDQLTNTNNAIRNYESIASFILLVVVMDAGFEGPQASLSSLDEFASLTRSPVYFLSTPETIDVAFKRVDAPGLHIMALSQKRMKQKINRTTLKIVEFSGCILYRRSLENKESTLAIIFYGTDPSIAESILTQIDNGISVDLFIMTQLISVNTEPILFTEINKNKSIVIIDTGKSDVHFSTETAWSLKAVGKKVSKFQRISNLKWSEVSEDPLEFTESQVINQIMRGL